MKFPDSETVCPLCGENLVPESAIPRRPWLLSKQYSMTFVLSKDNEIIMGDTACKYLGDDVLRHIIAAVNAYSPNDPSSPTAGESAQSNP